MHQYLAFKRVLSECMLRELLRELLCERYQESRCHRRAAYQGGKGRAKETDCDGATDEDDNEHADIQHGACRDAREGLTFARPMCMCVAFHMRWC